MMQEKFKRLESNQQNYIWLAAHVIRCDVQWNNWISCIALPSNRIMQALQNLYRPVASRPCSGLLLRWECPLVNTNTTTHFIYMVYKYCSTLQHGKALYYDAFYLETYVDCVLLGLHWFNEKCWSAFVQFHAQRSQFSIDGNFNLQGTALVLCSLPSDFAKNYLLL